MTEARGPPGPVAQPQGALWMLLRPSRFSVMTTLIKFLGDDYPAALQTFYRQAAGLVVLVPLILRHRGAAFATNRPGILIFRSLAGTLGMILSFYAFQKMPLADANALSFTRTLWLVPLAAFVVREPVGPVADRRGHRGLHRRAGDDPAGRGRTLRRGPAGAGHAGLGLPVRLHRHRDEGADPRPLARP